ncbi:MAG: argininosuccinate lyase [Candidatus Melainabacteria bacterium]|nr:argininosuccinate lyase [Candidatus Melainabacteria bacterium]
MSSDGENKNDSRRLPWQIGYAKRFGPPVLVEQALAPHQVASSLAMVTTLVRQDLVSEAAGEELLQALSTIRDEILAGDCLSAIEDPDLYTGLRRRLFELAGERASLVDIALFQNDQLATDLRLWLREACLGVLGELNRLRSEILELADRHCEVVMPGYTHLQPAVPELLAHWWLASAERLERDQTRLRDVFARINLCPLGGHAFAGATQPVDRESLCALLGFDGVIENSLDAVSDRDFVVEFAAAATLVGVHVSQLASELLVWSSREFGFVRLPRSFSFRSQNFPQKRNPELLEVLRSRASQLSGRLQQFVSELKGLTVSYSHDLEESLPGILDMVENLHFILDLSSVVLPAMVFDTRRMHEAASIDAANAGSAADFLIERGLPPEKATDIVERILEYCKERKKHFVDLAPGEWQQFSPAFDNEVYSYVSAASSIDQRDTFGGTARSQVEGSIRRARATLAEDQSWHQAAAARILNMTVEERALFK